MQVNSKYLNYACTKHEISINQKNERKTKLRRRRWTNEEDQLLLEGLAKYGKLWTEIAEQCFSSEGKCKRNAQACYDRFKFKLKNSFDLKKCKQRKKGEARKWQPEEDERLFEGIKKYGNQWKKISDHCFAFFNEATCCNEISRNNMGCLDRFRTHWQEAYTIQDIQKMESPIRFSSLKNTDNQHRISKIRKEPINFSFLLDSHEPSLYQSLVENSHSDSAKAMSLNDRKQDKINNIGLFTIIQPQELSRCQNGNFQLEVGIKSLNFDILDFYFNLVEPETFSNQTDKKGNELEIQIKEIENIEKDIWEEVYGQEQIASKVNFDIDPL